MAGKATGEIAVAERRERIIRAALKLFSAKGFERTTTKEIAREAGVAEGTIYNHFTSKRELLFAFLEESMLASIPQIFADAEYLDEEQLLRRLIEDRITLVEQNGELLRVVASEAMFNSKLAEEFRDKLMRRVLGHAREYLAGRMRQGRVRRMNPNVIVLAVIGPVFYFSLVWSRLMNSTDMRVGRQELIDELAALLARGMMEPVAIENSLREVVS